MATIMSGKQALLKERLRDRVALIALEKRRLLPIPLLRAFRKSPLNGIQPRMTL
jgi:hypothetical protein